MKAILREFPEFSTCHLNCGLCPMYHISEQEHCPGCGGKGKASCAITRCARQHGNLEFCFQCSAFPCDTCRHEEDYDSFISYRHTLQDAASAQADIQAYKQMLQRKIAILTLLLKQYNDGRHKSFFCNAVNALDLQDVELALAQIQDQILKNQPIKEQAKQARMIFSAIAKERKIDLTLRRKKKLQQP